MEANTPVNLRFQTLVDMARTLAAEIPGYPVYTYLVNGEEPGPVLTVGGLDKKARAIAASLEEKVRPGDRVLFVYPQSLDYVAGIIGCLYAGVTVVPCAPPDSARPEAGLSVLASIASDAEPSLVFSTEIMREFAEPLFKSKPELSGLQWISTDLIDESIADSWTPCEVDGDAIAFLQYTSGSTSTPKGVIFTHHAIMVNLTGFTDWSRVIPGEAFVSWLPQFHNMGLIIVLFFTLMNRLPCYLMAPADFLRNPFLWLRAISRYQASYSLAPNFAYDLCVQRITEEQRRQLDLSSWRAAICGSEPIRMKCLENFVEAFRECGFRMTSFVPGYGLTEAIVHASTAPKGEGPLRIMAKASELERNRVVPADPGDVSAREIVSCGRFYADTRIDIVNPDSLTRCGDSEIGEIWISGSSVSPGYWRNPEATKDTFGGYLSDTSEGPFLRTGDLGFLRDGQIFITGRVKDLIIIRGANHYPQDIEATVVGSHPALRPLSSAAFFLEAGATEQLAVVQEVAEAIVELQHDAMRKELNDAVTSIRRAVAAKHELQTNVIVLVRPGEIPRTANGKIKRRAAREAFINGVYEPLIQDILEEEQNPERKPRMDSRDVIGRLQSVSKSERKEVLAEFVCAELSDLLSSGGSPLSVTTPFLDLGVDSVKAMQLIGAVERALGLRIEPKDLFENATIERFAVFLISALDSGSDSIIARDDFEEGDV
jgi:acyl-CoA synthetase (AMP-forming)/AMP-acid ligase II/acyl carrier protein